MGKSGWNRMREKLIVMFIALGVAHSHFALSETLNVGFHDFPPMMIKENDTGIYKDILHELNKLTGDTYLYSYSSAARVNELFIKGIVDIEPGISPVWRSHTSVPGVYSVPFSESIVLLLFGAGKAFPVKEKQDLFGKELGTVRGYNYFGFNEYFTTNKIMRVDKVNEEQLIHFVGAGRIDQILVEKSVALYHISKNPKYKSLELGDTIESAEISMRVHPSKQHILERMNTAIIQMKMSGMMEAIYRRYQ